MIAKPASAPLLAGLFALVAAGSAIAGALIAQYGFDLYPCVLCHYQRWAQFAALGCGLLAVMTWRRQIGWFFAWLAALCFLGSAAIALFHVGVEAFWWAGLEGCSAPDFGGGMSREAIKQAILEAPVVSCDEVPFRFLGFSMAGWNLIFSLVAAVVVAWLLRRQGASA
ncbi:MAG: disulfide bond formation protein B [Rhodospirillales bacterium]